MTMAKKKRNIWKTIAFIFIIIFVAIIILGIWRAYHYRSKAAIATPEQIAYAKSIAESDLQTQGINATAYTVKVSDHIRSIPLNHTTTQTIEVTFSAPSIKHNYIIDVQTGKILMHIEMQFYDGLDHSRDPERGPDLREPFAARP